MLLQRSDRIQRNALKLQQLAVQQQLTELHRPTKPTQGVQKSRPKVQGTKKPAAQKQSTRSSARVRGLAADGAQPASSSNAANTSAPDEAGADENALACI